MIPDEVCIAAVQRVLGTLGTSLRHYESWPKASAIAAMRGVLTAQMERGAALADERAAICADAVAKIDAGELYAGIPTARASEECARLEATHIARLIRGEPGAR